MCPPCNLAASRRHEQCAGSLNHLHEEPQHREDDGGNFEEEWKEENRDQDDQAREREQARVASEHTSDCSRRAKSGYGERRVEDNMRHRCGSLNSLQRPRKNLRRVRGK
jgi:hypothetical protein